MSFRCGTAKWASILPLSSEKDDGIIFVDEVNGSGVITKGRHRRKGAKPGDPDEPLKNGKCKSGPDTIEFEREGFHYNGEISVRDDGVFVISGTRSRRQTGRGEEDGEEVDDGEVWVGVKTGT
jgi:hypothetical protein